MKEAMKQKIIKNDSATVIAADSKGKIPNEVKVLPYGEWNTYWYGMVIMTKEIAEQMVAYFNRGVRKGVPIDVDHDGGKAAGWVESLTAGEDGLYAEIEWTSYGKELLVEKIYRLFSPEWSFDWIDPQTSAHQGPVFIAGTLTNRPLLKELPLLASENADRSGANQLDLTKHNSTVLLLGEENIMNIAEILAKPKTDRTAEEVAFLTEHAAEMTDEQKTLVETESAQDDKKDDENQDDAAGDKGEDAGDSGADDAAGDDSADDDSDKGEDGEEADGAADDGDVKGDEGKTVTIKASELKELKAAQSEVLKAKQELKKRDITAEVNGLIKGSDGKTRIMPAQKEKVIEFLMNADEKTANAFREIVKDLPGVQVASEIGSDGQEANDVKTQVETLLASYKKEGLSEVKAQDKLEKENPELYKQYKNQ